MDHYKPHSLAAFEGYYTRIQLQTGGSLIHVICRIPKAETKPYQSTLTYVSASGRIWQQHCWPEEMQFEPLGDGEGDGFRLHGEVNGRNPGGPDEGDQYLLQASTDSTRIVHRNSDADFTAMLQPPTVPWSRSTPAASPESWLLYLPLPLHWHVYSLCSPCRVYLDLPDSVAETELDPADFEGFKNGNGIDGIAHQEKNWAHSFPSAHMWLQAREGDDEGEGRGIALAGGRVLGMDAFLMGYRNSSLGIELDFRPPWALRVFGWLGPFCHFDVDWERRRFSMAVRGLLWKLVLKAHAPKGSFYPLASPYKTGHKENWLGQSLQATVNVEVWKKRGTGTGMIGNVKACLLGEWELVCQDEFERGALEFGGDYYPMRGTDKKRN